MIRNVYKNAGLWVALLACFALATVTAQAQPQIQMDAVLADAAPTTVSGTGSYPMSMVEIFQNDASVGCVQAAADGTFELGGLTVAEGDTFYAQQQQSWYFDTDGDLEGWTDNQNLNVTVAGGTLSATVQDASWSALQNLAQDLVGAPTESLKVLEVRMEYTSAAVNWNVGANVGGSMNYHPMNVYPGGGYKTYVWPLLGNHPGYTTGSGEQLWWLSFAFNTAGAAIGDVVNIDYIRVREYVDYHFDNDGDTMQWVAHSGFSGGLTVANGTLSGAADGGAWGSDQIALYSTPWCTMDSSVYTVLELATASDGAGLNQELFEFQDGGGFGVPSGNFVNNVSYTAGTQVNTFDLTANGWGDNPPVTNTYVMGHHTFSNGENFVVDYIRFRPTTYYGPSNAVTAARVVTDPASVSQDVGDSADFDNIADAISWANATPGANTINILDSATYSEDIPAVTDSLTIAAAAGETPVLEKNGFGTTGVKQAIQFALTAGSTGTLTIQGAADDAKLTVRQAGSDKPVMNMGPANHGGNLVLENVVLERPATGTGSSGNFLNLNNQQAVALPTSLTNVDFVGADQAAQVPALVNDNTKDTIIIYPANDLTVNMQNVDCTQVNGMGNMVYAQTDWTTASFKVNIADSALGNNRVPATAWAGQVFLAAGAADVSITSTSFTGGDANGSNFSSAVTVSAISSVTLEGCDLRLNSGGSRIVAYDSPGCQLIATDCIIEAGSAPCDIVSGNPNGSYTFNNCSFNSNNVDANARFIQTYAASVQGEFVFNNPTFKGAIGGVPLEMTPGLKVTIAGTPESKVDLDPIFAAGSLMLGVTNTNGGGDLTLRDVKVTEAPQYGLFQSWAATTMTADLNLTFDRCEFLGGTGATGSAYVENYTGFGAGGSNFTATNCVFLNPGGQTTGPSGWFNVYGTHTAPSTITLTHCTFTGAMNSSTTALFSAYDSSESGRVDQLIANYNIFDDTEAIGVTYSFDAETGNISGTKNMWTGLDHVYNVPENFMMGANLEDLELTATGRLGSASSVAVNQALGSSTSIDVDGDYRPQNRIADIGADEVEFPTSVEGSWTLY